MHTRIFVTNTHREHTPGAVGSHFYAVAPGEQLGVAQGHLSRGIEGGERALFWVTSPTLQPLGHNSIMYFKKRRGPSPEPWGTPCLIYVRLGMSV